MSLLFYPLWPHPSFSSDSSPGLGISRQPPRAPPPSSSFDPLDVHFKNREPTSPSPFLLCIFFSFHRFYRGPPGPEMLERLVSSSAVFSCGNTAYSLIRPPPVLSFLFLSPPPLFRPEADETDRRLRMTIHPCFFWSFISHDEPPQ